MAIKNLRDEIKEILTAAGRKGREELSKMKFETLIFEERFIKEWCEYCQEYIGLTPRREVTRKMTARFFKAIRNNFRRSGNLYGIHPIKGGRGIELTKLDKNTKGFEFKQKALNQTLIKCKQEALDVLGDTVKHGTTAATALKGELQGHHGGPEEDDLKTTMGMVGIADNISHMNRGDVASIDVMLDELDQRSPETLLREVVQQQFSDYIELNMGYTRNPRNVKVIKGQGSARKVETYKVENDIQIKFALGGKVGKGGEYTNAMTDWDTPGGRLPKGVNAKLPPAIDKLLEKVEKNTLKFIEKHNLTHAYDMLKLKGSPSPIDHAVAESPKIIVGNMFPHRTRPDMRLKVNKALFAVGKKPKKTATKLIAAKTATGRYRRKIGRKGVPPVATKSKIDGKAGQNPIALRNLLNEVLPKAIAMQMISPKLQYRTGRFANSVRVENISSGPRGGNTMIETTYRKDPYETFAKGGKKYTFNRDPERLIKSTVRGIATGIIGGRFGVGVN